MKFEHPEFYFKSGDEMARHLRRGPRGRRQHGARSPRRARWSFRALRPAVPRLRGARGLHTPRATSRQLAREGLAERFYPGSRGGRAARSSTSCPSSPRWASPATSSSSGTSSTGPRRTASPSGPGRGSGAGSIVAYCLRITDIDPLKYDLLFERFLNPERVSMPDFDIDFCYERRGRGHRLRHAEVRRGQGRADHHLRDPQGAGRHQGRGARPRPALRRGGRHREARARGPEDDLDKAFKDEPEARGGGQPRAAVQGALRDRLKLEDCTATPPPTRRASSSAGAPHATTCRSTATPRPASSSTQYTMDYLEECGLVKMDFLGLKTLTLIEDALDARAEARASRSS